jgi:hypothetical protein
VADRSRRRPGAAETALAIGGGALFHGVSVLSGKVATGDGLGWDGQAYARMVTDSLHAGSANTGARPLLPLLTRIPYGLGLDVRQSFELMNDIYAVALYLFVALLLDRYGAGLRVKALIMANLALCIATSKVYGFYPAQVDLGALALVTAAVYFVMTDRHWPAVAACILAVASREFGIAAVFCGMHRSVRGRRWRESLAYALPLGVFAALRWTAGGGSAGDEALSLADAMGNLRFWTSPSFITIFMYFCVTVFGGISALLVFRPGWCLRRFREEPELATYLALVVVLAAAGSADIWRYLAFALPVSVALVGLYGRDADPVTLRRVAVAMTFVTVMTQRPFERMTDALYFRDWFPLYYIFVWDSQPSDLLPVWTARFVSVVPAVLALALMSARSARSQEARL